MEKLKACEDLCNALYLLMVPKATWDSEKVDLKFKMTNDGCFSNMDTQKLKICYVIGWSVSTRGSETLQGSFIGRWLYSTIRCPPSNPQKWKWLLGCFSTTQRPWSSLPKHTTSFLSIFYPLLSTMASVPVLLWYHLFLFLEEAVMSRHLPVVSLPQAVSCRCLLLPPFFFFFPF